jgi:hypothetical protein
MRTRIFYGRPNFSPSFFFRGRKSERDRQTLLTTWFVSVFPTITILMDQVVCVLLHKAKEDSCSSRLKNQCSNQDRDDINLDLVKKSRDSHTHPVITNHEYIFQVTLHTALSDDTGNFTRLCASAFPLSNIALPWTTIICKHISLNVLSITHTSEIKQ